MLAAQPVLRTVSVAVRVIGRPGAGVHGHMADSVGATNVISEHYAGQGGVLGRGGEVCKTVGSAYVGSNPAPATSENGPLAAETRPGGPFPSCRAVYQGVSPRAERPGGTSGEGAATTRAAGGQLGSPQAMSNSIG